MNTSNSSGLLTQSRAYPIMPAHQECQFAERITRPCALRSNRLTMVPLNLPLGTIVQFVSCSRIINPENTSADDHAADRMSSQLCWITSVITEPTVDVTNLESERCEIINHRQSIVATNLPQGLWRLRVHHIVIQRSVSIETASRSEPVENLVPLPRRKA